MSSQETLLMLIRQQELIQKYEHTIANQQDLITSLWEQVYRLWNLCLIQDIPTLDQADILANMAYAALCANRLEDAVIAANQGLGMVSDDSIDLINRLMWTLEQAQSIVS